MPIDTAIGPRSVARLSSQAFRALVFDLMDEHVVSGPVSVAVGDLASWRIVHTGQDAAEVLAAIAGVDWDATDVRVHFKSLDEHNHHLHHVTMGHECPCALYALREEHEVTPPEEYGPEEEPGSRVFRTYLRFTGGWYAPRAEQLNHKSLLREVLERHFGPEPRAYTTERFDLPGS